jgi:hypothetical protein
MLVAVNLMLKPTRVDSEMVDIKNRTGKDSLVETQSKLLESTWVKKFNVFTVVREVEHLEILLHDVNVEDLTGARDTTTKKTVKEEEDP